MARPPQVAESGDAAVAVDGKETAQRVTDMLEGTIARLDGPLDSASVEFHWSPQSTDDTLEALRYLRSYMTQHGHAPPREKFLPNLCRWLDIMWGINSGELCDSIATIDIALSTLQKHLG